MKIDKLTSDKLIIAIIKLLSIIGRFFSYLYPMWLAANLKLVFDGLYTGWIRRYFKKFDGIAERSIIFHGAKYISVGSGTIINKRARITAYDSYGKQHFIPQIEIGNNCKIGSDTCFSCIDKIIVGNNVAITARTLLLDNVHGNFNENSLTFDNGTEIPDVFFKNARTRDLYSKGPIIIEDNVHVGENCVIMSGVSIGHNSVISANTVVIKNIPPYSIVSGNPGRVLLSYGTK